MAKRIMPVEVPRWYRIMFVKQKDHFGGNVASREKSDMKERQHIIPDHEFLFHSEKQDIIEEFGAK